MVVSFYLHSKTSFIFLSHQIRILLNKETAFSYFLESIYSSETSAGIALCCKMFRNALCKLERDGALLLFYAAMMCLLYYNYSLSLYVLVFLQLFNDSVLLILFRFSSRNFIKFHEFVRI